MKIDDVLGGKIKIGSTIYNMVEAKVNGAIVWPQNYTYAITSAVVNYSAGTKLYAGASNFAYITGNVNVYLDGVLVQTITGATLVPVLSQNTRFSVNGNNVTGPDLGTTEYPEYGEQVSATYGNASTTVTITQEANVKSLYSRVPYGNKKYDYTQTVTEYDTYNLEFSSDKYSSTASAAPASGATTTSTRAKLSYTANHIEKDKTPYTQDARELYVYTARPGQAYEEFRTDYYTGEDYTGTRQVSDTPTITSSGTAGFSFDGTYVTIASEGTTEFSSGRSCKYTATVKRDSVVQAQKEVTLYQAQNIIVNDVLSEPEKHWDGDPYSFEDNTGYFVNLVISQYTTSANPAPASGGTASVIVTAYHTHTTGTKRNYYKTQYHTYTWSSGDPSYSQPTVVESGAETISSQSSQVPDNPTPVFVDTHDGFSFNDSHTTITVASRGTDYQLLQRSATVKATNGNATPASVTIYQAWNSRTSQTLKDMSIVFNYTGTIPASGTEGASPISVTARSFEITRYTYDSGAEDDVSSAMRSTLTTTNCSPTTTKVAVRGEETFTVDVGQNTSPTDLRIIKVTITNGNDSVSAQLIQDAVPIPTHQVATFLPYIPTTGVNKGKVYYTFTINSGSLTSGTVTGLYFKYQINGISNTYSKTIGSFNVAETSSPVLLAPSGVDIPTFNNVRKVKAWFEVTGSRGGFDTIYANETSAYTEVEFDPYTPPTPTPN